MLEEWCLRQYKRVPLAERTYTVRSAMRALGFAESTINGAPATLASLSDYPSARTGRKGPVSAPVVPQGHRVPAPSGSDTGANCTVHPWSNLNESDPGHRDQKHHVAEDRLLEGRLIEYHPGPTSSTHVNSEEERRSVLPSSSELGAPQYEFRERPVALEDGEVSHSLFSAENPVEVRSHPSVYQMFERHMPQIKQEESEDGPRVWPSTRYISATFKQAMTRNS